MKIIAKSEEETFLAGKNMSSELGGGVIMCLHGELGSGKTTFVKGLGAGLRIKNEIKSPTFTLMNLYVISSPDKKHLLHIDTYRLNNEKDLEEIGAGDYLGREDTISVIEWPEKISGLLKNKKTLDIFFSHTPEGFRQIDL